MKDVPTDVWLRFIAPDPQVTTDFLVEVQVTRFIVIAGCVILWWDWILTFGDEVIHIWPSRPSAVKFIFLVNRYMNLLVEGAVFIHVSGLIPTHSYEVCHGYVLAYGLLVFLSWASIHVLVILRAWAIWERQLWTTVVLVAAYVTYAVLCTSLIVSAFVRSKGRFIYSIEGVCFSSMSSNMWYIWVASLGLEYIAFGLTVICLRRRRQATYPEFRNLSPIPQKLYVSALTYILFNTLCHISNMVAWKLYADRPFNVLAVTFMFCLSNVAGQRLVLDLRTLNTGRQPTSQLNVRLSNIALPRFLNSASPTGSVPVLSLSRISALPIPGCPMPPTMGPAPVLTFDSSRRIRSNPTCALP
ncbi:hypothetical protein BD779DRAFT_1571819 [Infundibulicybe gibba]|nr:hypothetical protein BD779DRAFT_1571819 [Infundibulicybe gibba]